MPPGAPLAPALALLALLGVAGAGPFSPRGNGSAPAPRPPPRPGSRAGGSAAQLYEHTVEDGEKQVVFTHRINLPPGAGCGCPPGTEPPASGTEVRALQARLEALEELVRGLREQCAGGCCPPGVAQAGTGQTDVRTLCSLHGVFDLSRCACSCEPGWAGTTCSEPVEAGPPAPGSSRPPPSSGLSSPASCPDDCNDQGRCVQGRCQCFPGYSGPACDHPACPGDCNRRGRCQAGRCVCRPGYVGEDCGSRACPRGCSQRGRCQDGRCLCQPGYTGDDCARRTCPGDCSQRGLCQDGRCVCDPGYTGEDCAQRSCPRGCSQRGRCQDGLCVCDPGYTGEDCAQQSCPRGCSQRGLCQDGLCICDPGYTGEDCAQQTCPQDCSQRGQCQDGLCVCDPGYTGEDCAQRSCPRGCSQRGRCQDGLCVCNPGYMGEDCAKRSCPRGCSQRGRCQDGRCVCHPGYAGEDCGTRTCPHGCRGRGRCQAGVCVCNLGFTGEDCGARSCPGDCRGRGRCENGRCVCWPGYGGDDCGTRSCPHDCRGRGHCQAGRCVCDAGYTGDDCGARSCPGDCSGRGLCQDGQCVCDLGFAGEDCSTQSCPHDCRGRGQCQAGRCVCNPGFTGEDCGARSCPGDCNRRGLCQDGRCVCEPGYGGPACGTQTCPHDCRGRGRCVQGTCVCQEGYGGPDCEPVGAGQGCPGGCGPREWCQAGHCVCVEGFHGPDCAIQTCPADCRGRGLCRQGLCLCHEGFAGLDCGEEIPQVEGLRLHLLEETTVRTEWTRAPGPVDSYEIQFTPTTEGMGPPFSARVPSSASAFDHSGLAPGQEYNVAVRALRGPSRGPPTSQTITTMIDGPTDLRVTDVTPTTLQLAWLRPRAEVDRFVVSYVSAGNQRVRLDVPPDQEGVLLEDLMPGVEYVVTVTAERGRAVSYPASVRANTGFSSATDEPPPRGLPPPPTTQGVATTPVERWGLLGKLNVTDAGAGRLRVTWVARPETFDHFLLQQSVVGVPGAREETVPGEAREALLPAPGTDYELHLSGVSPDGRSTTPLIYRNHTAPASGEAPKAPRLGELWVSDVTPDSLRLSWTVPEGRFDSFMVQYKDAKGRPQAVPVEGPERSVTISPLDPARKYKFNLFGLLGKKRVGPISTEAKTAARKDPGPGALGRLGELWVSDPTPDSLRLSWTVPEGHFDSFLVQYKDAKGRPRSVPVEGPERSVTISPLDPARKYKFNLFGLLGKKRVGPISADGTTAPRDEATPTLRAPEPRLGELWVSDPTPDSLRLSWTVPEGRFDSFLVQYKDAKGRPRAVPVEGPERSVTISPLDPARKYKFNLFGLLGKKRVGPISADGTTAPQEEETPATQAPEPPRLGELSVSDETADSLRLSWTVPEGHFDSFVVQYEDSDGRPQTVRVGGDQTEVTISGLEPDRKYNINFYGLHGQERVGPVSVIGETAPGDEELLTSEPPTEPPSEPRLGELSVTDETPDSLSLSWTVPEGRFDSFVVLYQDADGRPQTVRVGGDQTEVTVSGLEPDRKYKLNLFGLHGKQRVGPVSVIASTAPLPTDPSSEEEEETTVAATEAPEPPRLGELSVSDVTLDSLRLSWTVPRGRFDSFVAQYKDRDGRPQATPVRGDQTEVTISGLEPNRKYKFLLFGLHGGKRHGPIAADAKTPRVEEKPAVLGELWVSDPTPDSLRLSWTVPEGRFDSFLVQYKDAKGRPRSVPVEGPERSVTISPLDPARKYKFNLFGLLGKKRVGPISADGTTAPPPETKEEGVTPPRTPVPAATAPPAPAPRPRLGDELRVTDETPDSLRLSWTVPEGRFDSFLVQYQDGDGGLKAVPVGGDQTEVTISDLEPQTAYTFLLRGLSGEEFVDSISALGETGHPASTPTSMVWAPTEAPVPPAEPRLGPLVVVGKTPDSLRLSWTVPEGRFDSFVIQYKNGDGQPQAVRVRGDQSEVTVSGLEPEHKYKLNLYGLHGKQRVGPTSVVGVTAPRDEELLTSEPPTEPLMEPPTKPRLGELSVMDVTPDSLRLSWTVHEGHFDSFLVQYKDADGRPQAVPVGGDQTEVTVSGLEPEHKYRLNLYGLHGKQRVGPIPVVGVTAPRDEEPLTPEPTTEPRLGELSVTDVTPDSLSLSWTVPEGRFDSFLVQYKDADGRPQSVRVRGDQTEVTVSGLEPERKYKLNLYGLHGRQRVGPISVVGVTGPRDDEVLPSELTTQSPTEPPTEAPSKPTLGELSLVDVTPDSLSLSWTVPEGQFDSFLVQYKDADGRPQSMRVGGDQTEVTVSGLEPERKYKLNLYGLHGRQRVGPISVVGVTGPRDDEALTSELPTQAPTEPSTEAPSKPTLGELSLVDVTPDSLSLSWTVPEGQFDSFLVQYKDADGRPQSVRVGGDQTEVTVSGLEPERKYKLNLYGLHGRQRVGPISVVGVTGPRDDEVLTSELPTQSPTEPSTEAPSKPTLGELSLVDVTPDSLSLSWTVPEGHFDSFLVQYKDADGRPQSVRVGGDQTEVTVSGLEPERKYKLNLYGLHGRQRVGPISVVGVTGPRDEEVLTSELPTQSPTEPSTEAPSKPTLGELSLVDVTPDSLSLSWTVPEGHFDSFLVQYKDADGQPQSVRVGGDQTEVTVSGLEPERKYKLNLYGLHGRQRVGPISVVGVTGPRDEEVLTSELPTQSPAEPSTETPSKPTLGELSLVDVTPDSLSLSWTVPEGHFDSFLVQYKDADGRPQSVRVGGDQTEVTVSGLEPERKYKLNLYGLHGRQRVGPISVVGVTAPRDEEPLTFEPTTEPPTEPPSEPRLGELSVTDVTPDSLSLSWTVPEGHFDSFVVQYQDTDRQPRTVRVSGDQTEVTVSGLEPDRKYKMNLYGFHGQERVGPVSVVGETAPQEESPSLEPRLGELLVSDKTPDSLSLSWTVPEGRFDSFIIQYKGRDGRPQAVPVAGDRTEVTVSGLEPNKKYKMNLFGFLGKQRVGPVSVVGVTDKEEIQTSPAPTPSEAPEPPTKPRLGELSVTDETPDSLSLSWTVPEGRFDSFLIQYKDFNGQPQAVPIGGDQTEVTVSDLEPDRKYKMHLYGLHGKQRVGPVSVIGETAPLQEVPAPTEAPEPPAKPHLGEVSVTDETPDSLRLSWTVPEGHFDSFLVQYRDADGGPHMVPVGGDQTEVTVSGLEPDRTYEMHFYGLYGDERLGPVSVVGMTAPQEGKTPPTEPPEPPAKPRLGELSVTDATPDSLSLSWTVPEGRFDSFLVQYKDADGQPQAVRVGGDRTEVTVSGLEPDRKYKMNLFGLRGKQRVGPASVVGVTAPQEEETPTTIRVPEPRLGELSVTDETPDSLHLSWTVPEGRFDSFLVQYKDRDGRPQVVPVGGDQTEVTVSGLEPNRKYKFLLFGLSGGKRRGPIAADAKTLPASKPSPRLGELTVSDATPDSLRLSWTVPEGHFDSFLIQYKDADGRPQSVRVGGDQTEVTVSGLEPARKYRFLLHGLSGKKRLGSITADGTTVAMDVEPTRPAPEPRLGELSVTDETPDSLRLSWTVPEGRFDSFLVQYRDTAGRPQEVPIGGDQTEVTVADLEPDRKYEFFLYGLRGGKRLGPVDAVGETAPREEEEELPTLPSVTEPPAPRIEPRLGELSVSDVTPDSLHLSWTVPEGRFDSFLVQHKDRYGRPQTVSVGGDQTEVTVSGLEPDSMYKFLVFGLRGRRRFGPISADATTEPAPVGEFEGHLSHLVVSDVTTSSLRLSWEAPPDSFDAFVLRYGALLPGLLEPPLQLREQNIPGSRRTTVLKDLRPGTLYTLTLEGLRQNTKADTLRGSVRTLSPVLESPRDLKFSDIGESSAKVSWTLPPTRVERFKISFQLADGGEPLSVMVDGLRREERLTGLVPGARYEVTVVSVRGFEESEPLTGFLVTVPDGPTLLRALNVTDGAALLQWRPPESPVDRYAVRVTAPAAPPHTATVPGSSVSYPLHNLRLQTNYTATVRGLRGPNVTSPAKVAFTTGLNGPEDLRALEVKPRSALLTWTEPQTSPTGYLLSYDAPGGQTQEVLLPGGVTAHRLTGLYPDTQYSVRLQAVRGGSLTPPVLTTFTTGRLKIPFPRDCGEEMHNGPARSRLATVFLNGNRERPLDVFCDLETDGGGWLVFQRRMDGHTDFWRDWADYAQGFGNVSAEFWLGNEALHNLTQAGDYSLRVDLRAGHEAVFAHYDSFSVAGASQYYRLHLDGYHGTAGDSMSYHSGSVFSTRDRDPNNLLIPCAISYHGGWWYRNCHYANLNGLYGSSVDHQGVSWHSWKGFEFSVPFTEMKMRPRGYLPPSQGA
ncbi:LOW QUALITY PROTEIN: tenascin-X [Tachyglossus aculeatus]|uniref:LOW QUALITY PROTEIN: tenascin-X n=1 Tax=Tachyglossus aculeatus TaxID=9261 RepID=UPI0018F6A3E8|nr:LOW QUALITY PROTEIN: tenascin-X [Tachyglossus aculeatus]